jgi:hypothetical protein
VGGGVSIACSFPFIGKQSLILRVIMENLDHVVIAFEARMPPSPPSDDVNALRMQAQNIEHSNFIWKQWAEKNGSVVELNGHKGVVEVDARVLDELPKLRIQYSGALGAQVGVGVGVKMSEAQKALLASKKRGCNSIVLFTPEVEEELKDDKDKDKPQGAIDQLSAEYLNKADPALNQGPGAGIAGVSLPSMPSVAKPKVEGSEHSEAEAMRPMVEGSEAPASPEQTNASADLEEKMHAAASAQGEQDQQAQPQQDSGNGIKAQVLQVLQQVRAAAPILEQISQSSPEVYGAVMNMTRAVIAMARELPSDHNAGPGLHSVAELDAKAGLNKSECESLLKSLVGWKAAWQHQQTGEVLPMPGQHDIGLLPGATGDDNADWALTVHDGGPWKDGFVDPEGKFYTREEAKPEFGRARPDSMNLPNESVKKAEPQDPFAESKKDFDLEGVPLQRSEEGITLEDLTGGTAEKESSGITEFDPKQIAKGVVVELEHTDKVEVALKICLDHLREDKDYYTKLEGIEGKETIQKAGIGNLPEAGAKTKREHVILPVGSQLDSSASGTRNVGKIKTQAVTGHTKWRSVRAGMVMGDDMQPRSSRSVAKKQ